MARDPFANYDAWLEKPYQDALADDESKECPICGAPVEIAEDGHVAKCTECDWTTRHEIDSPDEGDHDEA